uniref:Uncharacterized protein n=1 Tax=Aegilops tauschii subsp. strangulata TaxID=200361 RepID=A0A453ERK0_AEGTS
MIVCLEDFIDPALVFLILSVPFFYVWFVSTFQECSHNVLMNNYMSVFHDFIASSQFTPHLLKCYTVCVSDTDIACIFFLVTI